MELNSNFKFNLEGRARARGWRVFQYISNFYSWLDYNYLGDIFYLDDDDAIQSLNMYDSYLNSQKKENLP